METILLRDPDVTPVKEVLENILGDSYPAYEELTAEMIREPYALTPVWNYYKDGKAWLCKVSYRKKTVFWLSVWDRYFKTSFYFTEKHLQGVEELDISEHVKKDFLNSKPVGKLIPLIISVTGKEQLEDIFKITGFKKSLK